MKFPKLSSSFVLAPMAGVSDVAFRELCRRYGAGLTTTELIASAGIVRGNLLNLSKTLFGEGEVPKSLQLFGKDIPEIVSAAKLVEKHVDLLDFNIGCPAWRIVEQGCGSSLLDDPANVGKIVLELSSAVNVPVTVKIRSGTTASHITCVEVARACEDAGACAIAVHPRTAAQGYSGKADWSLIKKVKAAVSVPVIGNGDVWSAQDASRMLLETGCDYVMIGRGAIGNPGIFAECLELQKTGSCRSKTAEEKKMDFLAYLDLAEHYKVRFSTIKQHALNFTKGLHDATTFRDEITRMEAIDGLRKKFA